MIKVVNKPDLNAPRYRPERKTVCNKEFFKRFRKKFPQYKNVSDAELRKVINTHSTLMYKEAVENRDGVEFPEGLGFIFIGTCRAAKKLNLNYKASEEYNAKIQYRNFESDNHIAKIFYTNYANKYKFRNRELWQFKGARNFTRLVSKTYPENWKKYLQVENFELINKYFKKKQIKTYYANKLEVDIQDYNEFEMN